MDKISYPKLHSFKLKNVARHPASPPLLQDLVNFMLSNEIKDVVIIARNKADKMRVETTFTTAGQVLWEIEQAKLLVLQ